MVVEQNIAISEENTQKKSSIENTSEEINNQVKFLINKSRFFKLNSKIFFNEKTGNNVTCNYERASKNMQKLFLVDTDGVEKSYLKFIYKDGLYYIVKLFSFEKGNGGFLLDIFLKEIGNKGVYLIDDAKDLETGDFLNNFYSKKGFRKFGVHKLDCEDFLYKGGISNNNILKIKLENLGNQ